MFTNIAMLAQSQFKIGVESLHLDSSSFSVEGQYEMENSESIEEVRITYGHSKDHRPDLKQFIMDVICTGDGDIPLFIRIADGNEADKAVFAQLMKQFREEWNLDSIYVADSALYSADNLQQLGQLRWITLVPASLKAVNILVESLGEETFEDSEVPGYRIASCCSDYGGVRQRWLVIESKSRRAQQLKQLEKRVHKKLALAPGELNRLMKRDFACAADAEIAADKLSQSWKYHLLGSLKIETNLHYAQAGRPRKDQEPEQITYRVTASIVEDSKAVKIARRRAGRFILATNVLDAEILPNDEVLKEYKGQQSSERGFRCLGARSR